MPTASGRTPKVATRYEDKSGTEKKQNTVANNKPSTSSSPTTSSPSVVPKKSPPSTPPVTNTSVKASSPKKKEDVAQKIPKEKEVESPVKKVEKNEEPKSSKVEIKKETVEDPVSEFDFKADALEEDLKTLPNPTQRLQQKGEYSPFRKLKASIEMVTQEKIKEKEERERLLKKEQESREEEKADESEDSGSEEEDDEEEEEEGKIQFTEWFPPDHWRYIDKVVVTDVTVDDVTVTMRECAKPEGFFKYPVA